MSVARRHATVVLIALGVALTGCGDSFETAARKLEGAADVAGRATAATRLGEIGGPDAARILTLYGLRDPSPRVRRAAVEALSAPDFHVSFDLLGGLLDDPSAQVQAAAARALGERGGEAARRYLEVGYGRAATGGRLAIAAALQAAGGRPEAAVEEAARGRLAMNLRVLETGSVAERIGAAEELGRSGRPEAVAALLPLLASRSVALSSAAARGLGLSGAPEAVEPLARVVQEPYPELQAAAARALGALEDPAAVPALARTLETAGPSLAPEVAAALGSLARRGVPEASLALCEVAGGTDSPARASIVGRELRLLGAPCEVSEAVARRLGGRRGEALPALRLVEALGPKALDDTGRLRLAALTENADGSLGTAAWAAAAAARLPDSGARALEALRAAIEADRGARDEWVDAPLPDDPDWGAVALPSGEDATPPDELLAQLGADRALRARKHDDLVTRIDAWSEGRAERPPTAGAASAGAAPGGGTERPERIEVVPDVDPVATERLAVLAEAAGALAGDAAVPLLAPLLRHPELSVRLGAVRGLGAADGAASTGALVEAVGPEQPPAVLALAARALAERHAGAQHMIQTLERLPPEALPAAAHALGRMGGDGARFALATLLDTPAAPEAIRALGRLGGRDAARMVADYLLGDRPSGEVAAVEVLAELGEGPEVAELLRRALHDVRPEVRAAAAGALRRLGLTDPWLEALAHDYDRRVRGAVRPLRDT